jgi:pimeloyl-CoA synthetase
MSDLLPENVSNNVVISCFEKVEQVADSSKQYQSIANNAMLSFEQVPEHTKRYLQSRGISEEQIDAVMQLIQEQQLYGSVLLTLDNFSNYDIFPKELVTKILVSTRIALRGFIQQRKQDTRMETDD